VVTSPAHGTLTGSGRLLNYTPAVNYFGSDSFSFKASDGQTSSAPATIRIQVRPVDDAPVAVITISPLLRLLPDGTNLTILARDDLNATVVFDGSFSHDVENDPLEFVWIERGTPFAAGPRTTNILAVGEHTVTLQAADGARIGTAAVSFAIVSPGEAIETILLHLNESDLGSKNKRPLIASLKAAVASFDRGSRNAGISQLQAFENKLRAQVAPHDPSLATGLSEAIQRILELLDR
jgi:hypothetical protein